MEGKNYLDDIQFEYHTNSRPHLILQTMQLETHTLKHNLRTTRNRNLLNEPRDRSCIEGRRRQQGIERDRQ